jgi:hypothetical protein
LEDRAAEAVRHAGALIARHPDALPGPRRLRARTLATNRDWNAAIAALEGLFGAQPERGDIGLDLVSTLLACGRTDAADRRWDGCVRSEFVQSSLTTDLYFGARDNNLWATMVWANPYAFRPAEGYFIEEERTVPSPDQSKTDLHGVRSVPGVHVQTVFRSRP